MAIIQKHNCERESGQGWTYAFEALYARLQADAGNAAAPEGTHDLLKGI